MAVKKVTIDKSTTNELFDTANGLVDAVHRLDKSTTEVQPLPDDIVNYYVSAGQSLSIGYTDLANAPINTAELPNVFLYNGVPAIAPGSNEAINSSDTSSLVPFSQPARETHIYSMLESLMKVTGGTWIVAPQGRGGQRLIELNKGTEPFKNGVVMHDSAASAAASISKTIKVPFFTFIQGESDVASDVNFYEREIKTYYSDMVALHGDLSSEIPPMFISQIGTSGSIGFASKELEIANENSTIYCAGPNWPIARLYPSSSTDYTHLNAEGYVILGKVLGKAVEDVVYKGNVQYKPMQPEKLSVSNNVAALDFHTPRGNVVIDTTTFPQAPSLGIHFRYGTTIALQANDWTLNGNRLTMKFGSDSQPLVVGGVISGGNTLTDHSSTDGIPVPLINLRTSETTIENWQDWCCQFSIELTKEMGAIDPETDNLWTYGSPTIDNPNSYATVLGTSTCYFLDGDKYQVDYDSAVIDSGSARLWLGDDSHIIVEGGASLVMTRGSTKRLRFQSGNGGFSGKVLNLRIHKIS